MLKQRVLTAIVLIALLIVIFNFFPVQWIDVFFVLVIALAAREWAKLSLLENTLHQWLFALLTGLSAWLAEHLVAVDIQWLFIQSVAIFWLLVVFYLLFAVKSIQQQKQLSIYKLLLGVVVLLAAYLAIHWLLQNYNQQRIMLLLLVIIVWVTDSGAYLVGKAIGRHKFSKVISPGKTWQGVAGGLFFAALYGFFIARYFVDNDQRMTFFLLVVLSAWISVFGDLLESLIKRQAGIKDSGTILPGHGGILDRIDSLLAFLPVMAAGLYYVA